MDEVSGLFPTPFLRAPGTPKHLANALNIDRWVSPAPGDLVLFPSYILHAVPPKQGMRRITLSFNAIPGRPDSWGYGIRSARETTRALAQDDWRRERRL